MATRRCFPLSMASLFSSASFRLLSPYPWSLESSSPTEMCPAWLRGFLALTNRWPLFPAWFMVRGLRPGFARSARRKSLPHQDPGLVRAFCRTRVRDRDVGRGRDSSITYFSITSSNAKVMSAVPHAERSSAGLGRHAGRYRLASAANARIGIVGAVTPRSGEASAK